jgi:hypothetical protein
MRRWVLASGYMVTFETISLNCDVGMSLSPCAAGGLGEGSGPHLAGKISLPEKI